MAQEPRLERGRSRDSEDRYEHQDRRGEYGREQESLGYGRGREQGYDSDYGRGQGGQSAGRGYGQYARDENSGGGYGGDYGRWQQGDRYGRGFGKDGGEQFASDYGPRGRFREQGYGQGASGNWYGGESNTSTEGAYPRSYNEMYGQGSQGSQGFGGQSSQGLGGQSGQHRGKGPKNYSRSDDRIREDVSDRLTDDAHIDATEIVIEVKDGEVTLTGTVSDRGAKRRAEDTIESVSGVKHVQNNLRVKDGSMNKGTESTAFEPRSGTAKPSSVQASPKTA